MDASLRAVRFLSDEEARVIRLKKEIRDDLGHLLDALAGQYKKEWKSLLAAELQFHRRNNDLLGEFLLRRKSSEITKMHKEAHYALRSMENFL